MREEVPDVIGLLVVGVRVVFLGVNEVGELDAIADKEDGSIVSDKIPVSILGVKLERKSSRVTRRIWSTFGASHGGEACEHARLFAFFREQLLFCPFGDVRVCDDELTKSTTTHGVDNALGDALAVEPCELFNQVMVLDEDWSLWSCGLRELVCGDGCTRCGG